ncbi:MAG: AAA family ATPase [Deltaproteobacteria bacterium]|nr:AAA family ATPase [Deltaproteobacteria bacterium]
MTTYIIWNNKGGTGKTSLAFQLVAEWALQHPERRVLAVDLCPQANLSELLLGGLVGGGGTNLQALFTGPKRRSIGGYFQERLPSPFQLPPGLRLADFVCTPQTNNRRIPPNLDLLAGDPVVELQSNAIAALANTLIPGTNTWLSIIDWVRDILTPSAAYDDVFIDANPSFSMYTQIAIASAHRLILPATADDSSRRGIHNAFSLVYGVHLTSTIYQQHAFSTRLTSQGRHLPLTHLIVKNRLTQYMGPASAYASVLSGMDADIGGLLQSNPNLFTFSRAADGLAEVRDFQTTGVVAFAEGAPFRHLSPGTHSIAGQSIKINGEYLQNCRDAINAIVARL